MTDGGHPVQYCSGSDIEQRSPRRLRSRAGFTLLEALIVLLMISVVLSIAVPAISGLGNELQSAAHDTAGLFRQTRSLAMARTAAYRVVVVSNSELRGEFASTCDATTWQDEPRLRLSLAGGVVMEGTDISAGNELVCYSSRGIGDASPTVRVRDRRGDAFQVDVFTGGAITVSPVTGGS